MTIGAWGRGRGDADPQGGRGGAGRRGRVLRAESGGADGLGVSPGDRKEPNDRRLPGNRDSDRPTAEGG